MLKKTLLPACAAIFLSLSVPAPAFAVDIDTSELTGTVKLACEAILCLSSSTRPSECSPSLDHYFGINKKYWSDTLNARIDFLSQCPVMDSPGMPTLVNAIADGAGFCDVYALNRNTIPVYRIYNLHTRKWTTWYEGNAPEEMMGCGQINTNFGYYDEYYPTQCYEAKTVIDNRMPSRCLNYFNHEFTYFEPVQYEGDKYDGGKWVSK